MKRSKLTTLLITAALAATSVLSGCGGRETMNVYSMDGRMVHQSVINGSGTVDVSTWTRGVYIIQIGSRTGKLVVTGE